MALDLKHLTMKMPAPLFLTVALLLTLSSLPSMMAQISIPRREVGFVYGWGKADAPVHLDFYIDLICPDSKEAWPVLLQVADYYGPENLQLTTHLFPLPYHRVGFLAAKGTHVIKELTKDLELTKTYDWMNLTFENIDDLTNAATLDLSTVDVIKKLADLSNQLVQGSSKEFEDMIMSSGTLEQNTRTAWKYACTRGVAATPTFMVNDVVVLAEQTWSVDDWRKIIDPLLKSDEDTVLKFRPH